MTIYTKEDGLQPCPFCGSEDIRMREGLPYYITCLDCDCDGPQHEERDKSLELWNTRAAPEGTAT